MKRDAFLKLLTRKLSSELSASELQEFYGAVNSNREFQQLDEELTRYFEINQVLPEGISDIDNKLHAVWKSIDERKDRFKDNQGAVLMSEAPLKVNHITRYSNLLKIAAVIVVLLTAGLVFFNYHREWLQENTVLVSSGDQKIFMTLEDGTKIWLNRKSSLTYNENFGAVSRKISLKGEAFFDVAKNPDVPLSIDAGRIKVSVKGTAFNVKAYGLMKNIEVALIRGLVEITDNQDKTRNIMLKPNDMFVFFPEKSGLKAQYRVLKMDADMQNADLKWTQDTLVFKKEKLKDLVQQLEIRYKVRIEIQNEQLKNKRFSGSLTAEPLQVLLEGLKLSYPLSYEITAQKVIIK